MDFLMNIVRNLTSTDIILIIIAAAIFFLSILIILKGTLLQTGIRILTKKKVKFSFMILPTFLAIILNAALLGLAYLILVANDIDVIEIVFRYLFNALTDYKELIYIVIAVGAAELVFLIIQTFILKLVKYDIYKGIKSLFKRIFKKKSSNEVMALEAPTPTDMQQTISLTALRNIEEDSKLNKLTFVNGLLSGLFCFAIMFFFAIILIYIGELIGAKYISKL